MGSAGVLGGLILAVGLASCAAGVPQRGSSRSHGGGVIEAISRRDAAPPAGAADGTGVAGVASVLAGGSLSTPPGGAAPADAGTKGGAAIAGAVASAIAAAPATRRNDGPAYRISVRLDSGTLKTVEQTDVSALEVGQRVRLTGDRVVPE